MSRLLVNNACEEAMEDYDDDGCAWSRRETARIKQIQIGKARPEYQRYVREVLPSRRTPSQPSTPDPRARVSKRQFDRALGDWRRRLHEFDAVPRGPPRGQVQYSENEAPWNCNGQQSSKNSWGSPPKKLGGTGGGQNNQDFHQDLTGASKENIQQLTESGRNGPRAGNRRSRAAPVAPRTERIGKFGPRKALESLEVPNKDLLPQSSLPPPPPPPPIASQTSIMGDAASQQGVVRISLADQLMEIPMQPMMPPGPEMYWFQQEAPWGNMETPQKASMMGMDGNVHFMPMETPPNMADKQMMPVQNMCQPIYDECMLKADDYSLGMPMDASYMLPHRLFETTPTKSDEGPMLETHSSHSSGDGVEAQAPASPRPRLLRARSQDARTPKPVSSHLMCSPTPTTPKRQCYVPETPSPDRMHWLHQPTTGCGPLTMPIPGLQQPMPYGLPQPAMPYGLTQPAPLGGLPCYYGAQAQDQVMPPEFLQMSQMMPTMMPVHEGAQLGGIHNFGDLA